MEEKSVMKKSEKEWKLDQVDLQQNVVAVYWYSLALFRRTYVYFNNCVTCTYSRT